MNLKKILFIVILVITALTIPFIILAFLNIGGNAIFITLIVLVSLLVVLMIIFIIKDIVNIVEKKRNVGQDI
jgi:hypothetical protein